MSMEYSISQIATRFDMQPHTLRFYDKEGILPCPRTQNGIRYYGEAEVERLELICCLKATGMQLKQIKQYFDMVAMGQSTLEDRLSIFTNHRAQVLLEMEQLQLHLQKINKKIDWYKGKIANCEPQKTSAG